jgi:hypothetical protein
MRKPEPSGSLRRMLRQEFLDCASKRIRLIVMHHVARSLNAALC